MAWIRTLADDEAEGACAELFAAARARAGRVYGIVRVMSLDGEAARAAIELYLATTVREPSPLPRWFRELIAVTVSATNRCRY